MDGRGAEGRSHSQAFVVGHHLTAGGGRDLGLQLTDADLRGRQGEVMSRSDPRGALATDPKHTPSFATKKQFLKASSVPPSLLMCKQKRERRKKRKEKSKVSSLIVLLLVVEETDGAGLQSEGVKVGGGGVRSAGFFFFEEFC